METGTFLTQILPVRNQDLRRILERECRVDDFRKGEMVSEPGKTGRYVRFLISGIVKEFIVDREGKETTTAFLIHSGDIIADAAILDGGISEIGFRAITDSKISSLPVKTILEQRERYPEVMEHQALLLERLADCRWKTERMLYLKTARERYEWFLEKYPGLIDQVPHSDIASYLNMTPVTLSRIRHNRE